MGKADVGAGGERARYVIRIGDDYLVASEPDDEWGELRRTPHLTEAFLMNRAQADVQLHLLVVELDIEGARMIKLSEADLMQASSQRPLFDMEAFRA